jgi:hypothetical protein
MFLVATFPFENQSPEGAAADDWLIAAAAPIVISAIVIVGAAIARRATAVALLAEFRRCRSRLRLCPSRVGR